MSTNHTIFEISSICPENKSARIYNHLILNSPLGLRPVLLHGGSVGGGGGVVVVVRGRGVKLVRVLGDYECAGPDVPQVSAARCPG